eukprot:193763_1
MPHVSDLFECNLSSNVVVLLLWFIFHFLQCYWISLLLFILLIVIFGINVHLAKNVLRWRAWKITKPSGYIFIVLYPFLKFKSLETLWRYLTVKYRKYPDLYIIGEAKCGTTTLAKHFINTFGFQGPFCYILNPIANNKESQYFNGLFGLNKYVQHKHYSICFDYKSSKTISFDATTDFLSAAFVRNRIFKATPNAKFIVMVRDPVKRMISHYFNRSRIAKSANKMGFSEKYNIKTLSQFIEFGKSTYFQNEYHKLKSLKCNEKLPENERFICYHNHLQQGCYYENIKFYLEKFDKSQFLIFDLETDIKPIDNLKITLRAISNFMNINPDNIDLEVKPIFANKTRNKPCKEYKDCILKLMEFYKEPNEKFFKMVGRDLKWNDLGLDDYL